MKKKYIAYRGLILFTTGGRAPYKKLSRIVFWAFWDVMGNPMNGTEKKTAALMTRKKHGANSPIFSSKWMVRGGSKVWAFGDEAVGQMGGQTHLLGRHVLGRHASTLFDLDFGVLILDFSSFFFRVLVRMWWEIQWTAQEKKKNI